MSLDFPNGRRRAIARRLRNNPTEMETRLWRALRRMPMQGSHFRRQVPIGPYVVDFACMAAHLVIEVDGSQHGRDANIVRDDARTRWLEAEGYRVLRFWNNDIIKNYDAVLEAIHAAIYGSLSAEATLLKHQRRSRLRAGPTPALRADPPPAGEGKKGR
jgi:very-short-patch-repair endonuclease